MMAISDLAVVKLLIISSTILNAKSLDNPCGQLYLTQSPKKMKYLELNWDFTCDSTPDTILLTENDPLDRINDNLNILYKISPGNVVRGYHKTNVSFKDFTFPGNWDENKNNPDLEAKCFNNYIASVKNGSIIYSQCLSIQPTWMSNFGDLRIGELMIPGTHNSGAWRGAPPVIKDYVLNQDKNFWQQLVFGIRYFDIRVGRYGESPEGLYINHAFVRCTALLPELLSVLNFLKKSPKEIIILNFHRFPYPRNFTHHSHYEILKVVEEMFKDFLVPYPTTMHKRGPKLKELWESGRRVIISYANDSIIKEKNWLWPTVKRHWGNIQHIHLLEDYIKQIMSNPGMGNPMTVLMAELTPNYFHLRNVTKNLKDLAAVVNKDLAHWMRSSNNSSNLNIIATDFFTGNDIINLALETNFRKINNT